MACIFCNQDVQTTRAKEKMYVWTCTKETLRCNLTCYNVQYNCIAFDLGNFYAETNFQLLHLHFWSSPLMCHPRPLFTSASLLQFNLQNTWQMCSHAVLCYDLIQLYVSSWWRSQYGASTELMFNWVMKTSGFVLVSCFSLKLLYLV